MPSSVRYWSSVSAVPIDATTFVSPAWWQAIASKYPSTMTASPCRRASALAASSAERLAEVEVRGLVGREQSLLALALGGRATTGELDAGLIRELLQRVGLVEPVHLHEPVEDIALFAAAEAMKGAAVRIDAE